jgi:Zn-dependent protease
MDILEVTVRVAIVFIPFLFALCFHEFAHGWVAKKLGDNTAETMGRLTLNPLAHADPIGTFVLPIASILMNSVFFGWAKPVPVNERNLKHPKKDMFWIAAAGPASNFLLAFLSSFILVYMSAHLADPDSRLSLMRFFDAFISINLALAIFNLIPIPPLDGAKVLGRFLPDSMNDTLEANSAMLSMILLFLFISGAMSILAVPIYWSKSLLMQFATSVVV